MHRDIALRGTRIPARDIGLGFLPPFDALVGVDFDRTVLRLSGQPDSLGAGRGRAKNLHRRDENTDRRGHAGAMATEYIHLPGPGFVASG